jgi:hypothetical protein
MGPHVNVVVKKKSSFYLLTIGMAVETSIGKTLVQTLLFIDGSFGMITLIAFAFFVLTVIWREASLEDARMNRNKLDQMGSGKQRLVVDPATGIKRLIEHCGLRFGWTESVCHGFSHRVIGAL